MSDFTHNGTLCKAKKPFIWEFEDTPTEVEIYNGLQFVNEACFAS